MRGALRTSLVMVEPPGLRLHGGRALVTGASGAVGTAVATRLAAEGVAVAVHYHSDRKGADATLGTIEQAGGRGILVAGDLSTVDGANSVVDDALDEFGGLDIVVNNAGITDDALIIRMKDNQWDDVLRTNLGSAFACCRRAVRSMLRQRSGRIINISSVVGIAGNAGQTNYAASKAGLIGLTRALAKEVAGRGITVNAVAPGFVVSRLTNKLSDEMRATAVERIPLGRLADPADIAGAVAFLASPDAAYVTGHVLTVDGGLTLSW